MYGSERGATAPAERAVRSLTVRTDGALVVLVADDPREDARSELFMTTEAARKIGELLVQASDAVEAVEAANAPGPIFPPKVGEA